MVVQRAVVRILVMLVAAMAGIVGGATATAATAQVAGTPSAAPIRLAPGDIVLYPGYKLVKGRYDCYLGGDLTFYTFPWT